MALRISWETVRALEDEEVSRRLHKEERELNVRYQLDRYPPDLVVTFEKGKLFVTEDWDSWS